MTTIQPVCTNHRPICPNCNQECNHPSHQPVANNYSGVSIDIHNPAVNIPPYNPIYDIPQASVYAGEIVKAEEVK